MSGSSVRAGWSKTFKCRRKSLADPRGKIRALAVGNYAIVDRSNSARCTLGESPAQIVPDCGNEIKIGSYTSLFCSHLGPLVAKQADAFF